MAVLYGHTGRVLYNSDNLDAPYRMTRDASLMVSDTRGRYHDAVQGGRVYIGRDTTAAAAGIAIPIYSSVTPVGNVIWNPAGSGVLVVPIHYQAEYVSGNVVAAPIFLMLRGGAGSEIATAATFSAFAKTTPLNAKFGLGEASKVFFSGLGTCTLTTAGAIGDVAYDLFGLPTLTGQAVAFTQNKHEFNGKLVIPPGTVAWVAGTAASGALFRQTWLWEEINA